MYALLSGAGEEGKGTLMLIAIPTTQIEVLMRAIDYTRPPTVHPDFLTDEELTSRGRQ
jgi:hypothetical protein